MEKVALGTKVRRLGIQRLLVGDGMKCRAVLLDVNPRMKHIAYDDNLKCRVEVDQDMVIKYGLRPSPTFYYLVAKLNTDLNGNIVGDTFSVEYLQLSENLNNEFADALAEQKGVPASLSMVKVKKSANGKDFSYIKVTPSQVEVENPELLRKLNELRSNQEFIDSCWSLVDSATSLNKEQYLLKLEGAKESEKQLPPTQEKKQLPPTDPQSNQPASDATNSASDFAKSNDFGDLGDDFS